MTEGFIESRADEALEQALSGVRSRGAVLCAIARKAGDMLAESEGHDSASRMHASRARIHAEKAVGQGRAPSRGRR